MHLSVCPCSPTFPSCFLSMPPCKSFTHEICASIFCFMIPLISYCLALIKSVYKKIFYPIFVFFALNLCKYALPDIGFLFSNRSKKAPAEQWFFLYFGYPHILRICYKPPNWPSKAKREWRSYPNIRKNQSNAEASFLSHYHLNLCLLTRSQQLWCNQSTSIQINRLFVKEQCFHAMLDVIRVFYLDCEFTVTEYPMNRKIGRASCRERVSSPV